ncbi:MAG: Glycerol-3-phosphate ABC transporter, permease protein [Thermotoga sp. 47_83]|nr:MAG: Glycerol-3-phosphate ABC transporter, permease protein [Thermotoga sp. 47_83]MBZ4661616.1 glycerol-3-phosphate transporter permease [Thermotoga sp.]HBF70129.1 sugar ABC transporter permease [Thermotoga sp.]
MFPLTPYHFSGGIKLKRVLPYLLLLPTFVIITLFIYWPAVYSLRLSFYRITPFGNRMVFVGLRNFQRLFQSPEYLNAIKVTVVYVLASLFLTIFLAFFIALLLNMNLPGNRIFRALIFTPYAISPAIAGVLWSFLLNPVVGHVNYILSKLFGLQVEWLTTKPYALIAVIIATVWKTLPFDIIFYLAGLQDIPQELIEASLVEGANSWARTWKIVFPLLSPITFYLVIMNLVSFMFSSFAIIDVTTKGGPGNYTTTLIYRLYLDAFAFQKIGPAAAQSVILFLIMAIVTIFYFKFGEKRVHYQ